LHTVNTATRPPPCQTRPATGRDADAIAAIHTAALRAVATGSPADGPAADRQQVFWRDAIAFGEPQLVVACDGDTVLGFAGFDRSRDKGTPPTMGEIWYLVVAPAHWGLGVGLALWDAARDGLLEEGCTQVSVWVGLRNERALRFHELAGFKRELSSARTTPVAGVRVEEIRLKRKL